MGLIILIQLVILIGLFSLSITVDELIAYDCSQPVFDRSYSIMNQEPCASQFAGSITLKDSTTQVIQVVDSVPMEAYKCSVSHKITTGYCNIFLTKSDAAHIKISDDFIHQDISYEDCKMLWKSRTFSKHGKSYSISLGNINHFTFSDDLSADGYCTKRFKYYSVHSYRVLVSSTYISLKFIPSGEFLGYKSQDGLDIHIENPLSGTTITKTRFWWVKDETHNCRFFSLYSGPAIIASDIKGTRIAIIKSLTIALSVKQEVVICNQVLALTNELGIYIASNVSDSISMTLKPSIKVWNPAVLSVSQYLLTQLNVKLNLDKEVWNVAFCKLEQSTHLLSALSTDTTPGELGFRVLNEPGWAIIKAGQVLKVAKCKEVIYTFNITNRCYSKIPISIENQEGKSFLDPLTKEIVPSALRESCASPNLPQIQIRQKWYIFNPKYHEVPVPHQLPSRIMNFKDELLEEIKGISLEDIHTSYQSDKLTFYSKDVAVNSLLALSDPTIGDSESELWASSGTLYQLLNPKITLIHYISICGIVIICVLSNIVLWVVVIRHMKNRTCNLPVDQPAQSTVINVSNGPYPKVLKAMSGEQQKLIV